MAEEVAQVAEISPETLEAFRHKPFVLAICQMMCLTGTATIGDAILIDGVNTLSAHNDASKHSLLFSTWKNFLDESRSSSRKEDTDLFSAQLLRFEQSDLELLEGLTALFKEQCQ